VAKLGIKLGGVHRRTRGNVRKVAGRAYTGSADSAISEKLKGKRGGKEKKGNQCAPERSIVLEVRKWATILQSKERTFADVRPIVRTG